MSPPTPKGLATRERLLEATARLLKKQGYHRMGLQDIIEASGAPKGSLYFHFPGGKEQVVAEAVGFACRQAITELEPLIASSRTTAGAIEKVFRYGYEMMSRSQRDDIIPLGLVGMESNGESDLIRQACEAGLKRIAGLFRELLLKDGVLPEQVDDVGMLIAGSLEGGFVLSRTRADETHMLRAGKLLAEMIRSYTRPAITPRARRRAQSSPSGG